MATSKTTPKPHPKRKSDPDAKIIAAAVKFAQCMAGIAAGFTADPDGDCKYAGPPKGSTIERERSASLAFLGKQKATTPEGLNAKARVVPIVIKNDTGLFENGGALAASGDAFLLSFATEVEEFTQPMADANWSAAVDARKAVSS